MLGFLSRVNCISDVSSEMYREDSYGAHNITATPQ
jgi:hypothetical protein